jgi:cell division protein ZapA
MQDRLVRFHLFGQEYTFFSDAPEDEVESIITLLREELDSGEKLSRSAMPSSKMLVLGCLRMTAKYVQLNRECTEYRQAQQQMIDRLIDRISVGLE